MHDVRPLGHEALTTTAATQIVGKLRHRTQGEQRIAECRAWRLVAAKATQ